MKKRELKDLSQFTYKDADGKEINLQEFLEPEDYWKKEGFRTVNGKRQKTVLGVFVKHSAIQRLAEDAHVSLANITLLVSPTASNEQQHLFTANFYSPDLPTTSEVGEASTRNCEIGVSRKYMGSIAFKRLFDRGVLAHLGFFELYSEEESEDFNQDELAAKMATKDFEALKDILNDMSNASSVKELDDIKDAAVKGKDDLNEAQRKYVASAYKKCLVDLEMGETALEETKPEEPKKEMTPLEKRAAAANAKLEQEAQKAETKVAKPSTPDPLEL